MTIDRFQRQQDLVPFDRLELLAATIIGVGAIGRQVAIQLAALGVRRLQLVDFDLVEPTNISTQGYLTADLGQRKVDATARQVHQIDPTIRLETLCDRYRPRHATGEAIFCGVDSITTRAALWKSLHSRHHFWCDGRMLGESIRILTADNEESRTHYQSTLFPQTEAQTGTCTTRGTLYTASIAAGLMLHQFTRWLRGITSDPDLSLNLLASELSITDVNDQSRDFLGTERSDLIEKTIRSSSLC